ncbi:tetratricopeptide repeat protein [bacterium]|nr:tetratricopeptide repeat protein [bacterium]MBU0900050.1 tetratricopeptide repeat protein [bacterium]MBU1153325.1 tetratricopeptide repeat protein [bacterium]MBU2599863.1 tetratricopeptide repeat protein [bacterium]
MIYKVKRKIKKRITWLNENKRKLLFFSLSLGLLITLTCLYLYKCKRDNEKIENIKKILLKDPTNIEKCIELGDLFYKKVINPTDEKDLIRYTDETIKYYRKAIALDKEELIDPIIFSRLGIAYFKKSRELNGSYYYVEAIQNLEEAINRGYNNYETYLYLGHVYFKNDIFDKAILNYENALKMKSNDSNILFNIAWTYKSKGDYRKAMEKFNQVLEQRNLSPKIRLNTHLGLGEVFYYLNSNEETLKHCQKVLDIDKNSIKGRYWLGKVYLRMGKFKKAKEEWKKIFKLNPTDLKSKK